MAADPTVSIYGMRGLTGNGDVATADIADDAVTAAKMATDAVTGDTIAALGVDAGKLNLGAVSTALAIAAGVVNEYHRANTTNTETVSRDIAYTDVGDVIACTGPITLTVPLDMTSSGSTGWRLGQFCFVECANASTVTLAAAGGVTLTAPSGLVLDGAGAVGILLRVGTNSWRFHTLAGNTFLPVAAIDATGTPSSTTILRGDGAWVTPSGLVATTATPAGPSNSAAETTLFTASTTAAAGQAFRLVAWGDMLNNTGSAQTVTLKFSIGSTAALTTAAASLNAGAQRREWFVDVTVLCPTTGSQVVAGAALIGNATADNWGLTQTTMPGPGSGSASEDMTSAKALALSVTLGAADPNLDFMLRGATLNRMT